MGIQACSGVKNGWIIALKREEKTRKRMDSSHREGVLRVVTTQLCHYNERTGTNNM